MVVGAMYIYTSDDAYERLCDVSTCSYRLATVAVMRDRVVVVNSISKTAKATGWRIGWVVASAERTEKIRAVHDQLVCCCPTPLQVGVAQLLAERANDETYFATIRDEYLVKRDLLVAALREVGFEVGALPQGAYYIFARYANVQKLCGLSPTEAAMFLTTQVKVACVPGARRGTAASRLRTTCPRPRRRHLLPRRSRWLASQETTFTSAKTPSATRNSAAATSASPTSDPSTCSSKPRPTFTRTSKSPLGRSEIFFLRGKVNVRLSASEYSKKNNN